LNSVVPNDTGSDNGGDNGDDDDNSSNNMTGIDNYTRSSSDNNAVTRKCSEM